MSFFGSILESLSATVFGDSRSPPSEAVLAQMETIRSELTTAFDSAQHSHLLERLSEVIYAKSGGKLMTETFIPVGSHWKAIGFQHEDPVKDIRGGGLLCLRNMIEFVESNDRAIDMILSRMDREEGRNYPWAAASINVTRMVAKVFEIVGPNGNSAVDVHSRQTYWSVLDDGNGFQRIYEEGITGVDESFTKINGTYMDFPRALKMSQEHVECYLNNVVA